jgi:hypothetical protein
LLSIENLLVGCDKNMFRSLEKEGIRLSVVAGVLEDPKVKIRFCDV